MNLDMMPPLPEGTPKRVRASLALIQFLRGMHKLDGLMAFAGVWWGFWTLLFPHFWYGWPVTQQLAQMTGDFPAVISWILLLTGLLDGLCRRMRWPHVRTACSLMGFVCWCMLTTAFALVKPIFSPAVACYSFFAIAKLLSYVNHVIRLDEHDVLMADHGSD